MANKDTDQRRGDVTAIAERLGLHPPESSSERSKAMTEGRDFRDWALHGNSWDEPPLRPELMGSIDGLPVVIGLKLDASVSGDSTRKTMFSVSLPGWPTSAGLRLRPRQKRFRQGPILRKRYIWFDDAEWDDSFAVSAHEPDTVRIHLDARIRALIKSYIKEAHETGQNFYLIVNGRLFSSFDDDVMSPDVIAPAVRKMVEHVRAILL